MLTSLSASESEYSSVIESDMVVGVVPEFECDDGIEVGTVALNFDVEDSFIENSNGNYAAVSEDFEGIKRFNVFKYFDDIGMLLPIETTYDTENNTVTTNVDELGTYCLVDMEKWFETLGISPEEFATVNVSPSSVGMMGIPMRAAALAGTSNTVTTPIDVVFHAYAKGTNQDKVEDAIRDTATRLFDVYGRNGNVRIYAANYLGTLGVTDNKNVYAENEEDLETILDKISGVNATSVNYSKYLNNLTTNCGKSMRENSDRYYIFVENMAIDVDLTERAIANLLDENKMSAIMISKSPYVTVATNTGGKYINKKDNFGEDVAEFIIKNNSKNNSKHTYLTMLPTSWKEVTLDKPIGKDYKDIADRLEAYKVGYINEKVDTTGYADTDKDGLLDLEEIKYEYIPDDANKPVFELSWDENGDVVLPTLGEIMDMEREIRLDNEIAANCIPKYIKGLPIKEINNIRILPVKSDPTKSDTDGDSLCDDRDLYPLSKFSNVFVIIDDYDINYMEVCPKSYYEDIKKLDYWYDYYNNPCEGFHDENDETFKKYIKYSKSERQDMIQKGDFFLRLMGAGGNIPVAGKVYKSFDDLFSENSDCSVGQLKDAAEAVGHYLENTGVTLFYNNYPTSIITTVRQKSKYCNLMNKLFDLAENTLINNDSIVVMSNPAMDPDKMDNNFGITYDNSSNNVFEINWYNTIGSGKNSIVSKISSYVEDGKQKYEAEVKFYIFDTYDFFDKNGNDHEDFAILHLNGNARCFLGYGVYQTKITWNKGERFPTENIKTGTDFGVIKDEGITKLVEMVDSSYPYNVKPY